MKPMKNMPVGGLHGRLRVLGPGEPHFRKNGRQREGTSLCLCSCGRTVTVRNDNLRAGRSSSCGCLKRELVQAKADAMHAKALKLGVSHYARRTQREIENGREKIDRAVLFARDGGICHICSELVDPENWHADHVVSLVNGGPTAYDNLAVAHPVCNLRKWAN